MTRFVVALLATALLGSLNGRTNAQDGLGAIDAANQVILDRLETINRQLRAAAAKARLTTFEDVNLSISKRPNPITFNFDLGWREMETPFGKLKVNTPEPSLATRETPAPPASDARNYATKIEADAQRVGALSAALRQGQAVDIRSRLGDIQLSAEATATLRATKNDTSSESPNLASLVFVPGADGGFTVDHMAVGLLLDRGSQSVCTGTLVRPNVVLTAAHCFCPPQNLVADTADKCMVWPDRPEAGRYSFFISGAGVFGGRSFRVHSNYSFFAVQGDVALLEIEPVSGVIPLGIDEDPVAEGTSGRLVGYGMRAIRTPPMLVAANTQGGNAAMPLAASNDEQARTVGIKLYATQKAHNCLDSANAICWTFDPANAPAPAPGTPQVPSDGVSCPGDSGGPFLVSRVENGTLIWVVAGVISAGDPVACGAKTTAYNMKLSVELHRKWLSDNLKELAPPAAPGTPAQVALKLTRTDAVSFGALDFPDVNSPALIGRTSRTINIAAGLRSLRLALNGSDLMSGGPLTFELRRPPATGWQTCAAAGGISRAAAQGGLQSCEFNNPVAGALEWRISGRFGREIQLLATQWAQP